MGSEWKIISLGEFIRLKRGHDLTAEERKIGNIPVIGSAGQNGFHDTAICRGPGLTIGRSGVGSMGVVTYVPTDFWPHNTVLYATDFLGNDPRFAYYFLSYFDLRRYNSGSAQASLNRNYIYPLEICVPEPTEQRAIAHILGTLDDKIELNRQMNATLEAMAQALFQSWFVDFDPVIDNALAAGHPIPDALQERAAARAALGHHRQPLPAAIQSQFPSGFVRHEEMGWVPEGWAVSTIGHEIQAVGGGTPSTKDASFWEDGVHAFCTPKDMSLLDSLVLTAAERQLTDAGVAQISSGQLPAGVVLLSSRAPIGYLAISHIPVSVNQGIIAMLPNANYEPLYLVCWVRFNMDKILDRANGSTFLEISKKNFAPIPFLVPNRAALDSYNLHAKTIYEKLLLLAQENEKLITLRDTLLPKLLSGAVRVAAAG
jgi:type I restriction enzyme S subunit